jgi:hypothetical protein
MRNRESKKSPVGWGSRLFYLCMAVMLLFSAAGPAFAADPAWRGEYYNNTWLGGAAAVVRDDANINFDWSAFSPATGVNNDNFSARWTRSVYFDQGTYQFTVVTDDGARLWIDGELVLDKWFDQPPTTYNISRSLNGGDHAIRLEYYEHLGNAKISLAWVRTDVSVGVWHGEFYSNMFLTGAPTFTRDDPILDFNWGSNPPGSPVPADNFSIRWTRVVNFGATGNYSFEATHDDGMRVWVDEQLIVDHWYPQAVATHYGGIHLTAGDHRIRVEYFEQGGDAVARLRWYPMISPTPTPTPIPQTGEVVVDEFSSGFLKGGPISGWKNSTCGYGGHSYWTFNNVYAVSNFAQWTPTLPQAGRYTVYVYVPSCNATTTSARYRVLHAGMRHDVWVNQYNYSNAWVRLGTFTFNATGNEYVYLADNTHEAYLSRRIGIDAVKFVWAESGSLPTCSIVPKYGFGRIWNTYSTVRNKLGCPVADEFSTTAAEEKFIGGYMFWTAVGPKVYALYNNGTWQSYSDTWAPPQAESDPSIVPPWGYYQPLRGFGKVWRENPSVRGSLSWATEQERGLTLSWQNFAGGSMFWSNRLGIFVLYNDGTWKRYD